MLSQSKNKLYEKKHQFLYQLAAKILESLAIPVSKCNDLFFP